MHCRAQHHVAIDRLVEHESGGPAVDFGHRDAVETTGPARLPVAVDPHDKAPRTTGRQLIYPAGDDQPAVIDDRHGFSEIFDVVELMAREQHAASRLGLFDEDGAYLVDSGGIEP
jgi:hypothetical protein